MDESKEEAEEKKEQKQTAVVVVVIIITIIVGAIIIISLFLSMISHGLSPLPSKFIYLWEGDEARGSIMVYAPESLSKRIPRPDVFKVRVVSMHALRALRGSPNINMG